MTQKLRVLYAAGPGDVIGTYHYWKQGQDDPSQVAITFSGQFYEVCSRLNAQGYVISSNPQQNFVQDGQFTLEHRPVPLAHKSGVLYHLGQIWYGMGLVFSALRFKADIVVACDTSHYFVLSVLPLLGIQVVASLHCVLWHKYLPPSKGQKLLFKLNQSFFAKDCLAVLAISEDVIVQVQQVTHNQFRPIIPFLSYYRRSEFAQISPPDLARSPFRVLFGGRIERDKGVFDLLEIAKRFLAAGRKDIVFDICGDGSALEEAKLQAEQDGVSEVVNFYGYCKKEQMRERFNAAHVVIVPTTIDFVEGLNKVVVEAILAGRPVITSSVCPALSYVRTAAVEVAPNDTQSYGDAILQLYSDRQMYEEKRANCLKVQEQFYDASHSWGTALQSVLSVFNSPEHPKQQITKVISSAALIAPSVVNS
jgi:glycogen synthase